MLKWVQERLKNDIKEQRTVLIEEKRELESEWVKNEGEEERNITLEEQHHRNLQRQQTVPKPH